MYLTVIATHKIFFADFVFQTWALNYYPPAKSNSVIPLSVTISTPALNVTTVTTIAEN